MGYYTDEQINGIKNSARWIDGMDFNDKKIYNQLKKAVDELKDIIENPEGEDASQHKASVENAEKILKLVCDDCDYLGNIPEFKLVPSCPKCGSTEIGEMNKYDLEDLEESIKHKATTIDWKRKKEKSVYDKLADAGAKMTAAKVDEFKMDDAYKEQLVVEILDAQGDIEAYTEEELNKKSVEDLEKVLKEFSASKENAAVAYQIGDRVELDTGAVGVIENINLPSLYWWRKN